MASNSVNDLLCLINQQVEFQENLSEHLHKAEAMTHVALGDDFLDCPQLIAHYYIWVLSDIIVKAKMINEQSLDILLKQRPLSANEI
jgi:hypothetical protein